MPAPEGEEDQPFDEAENDEEEQQAEKEIPNPEVRVIEFMSVKGENLRNTPRFSHLFGDGALAEAILVGHVAADEDHDDQDDATGEGKPESCLTHF
jgi:hypothetical protein